MPLAMSYVLQLAMLEPSLLLMSWCFFMFLVRLYNFYFLFADRESEPNSWHDELDRKKYPRMPWHDVHCALWVPPCCDIARHFVQRWNHAKRTKAPNEHGIPLLMPHHHMVLPRYMARSKEIDIN
ncbi:hypothetical protein GLYMA_10G150250v4 [Glycine max]|nr:hypothetical protein GLYMA_10G150250v4 [Glycine max]KAH1138320.1 hypothetical protein GYH30_028049 [Glycine max]